MRIQQRIRCLVITAGILLRYYAAQIRQRIVRWYDGLRVGKTPVVCKPPRPITADDLEQLSDAEINALVADCVKAGMLSKAYLNFPIPLQEQDVDCVLYPFEFVLLTSYELPPNPRSGYYMFPNGTAFEIRGPHA